MADHSNNFEGGTNGTGITTGNSGGASGDAFSTVTLGGTSTATYDSAVARGTLSGKIVTPASANNGYFAYTASISGTTEWHGSDFYLTANPGANTKILECLAGSTSVAGVQLLTTGKLRIVYASGGSTGQSGFLTVPTSQWFRVEFKVISDSAAGSVLVRYYADATSTVISEMLYTSGVATHASSAAITAVRVGVINNVSSFTLQADNIGQKEAAWPSGSPDGLSSYEGTRTPSSTQGTGSGIQVGTVFQASTAGKVSALRYYRRDTLNDGANVVVTLFNKLSGTLLAQATHAQVLGDGTGWVTVPITTQTLAASTDYIAAAYYSTNRAAKGSAAFSLSASPLTASAALITTSAANGNTAPATTDTNDWYVDVVFTPVASEDHSGSISGSEATGGSEAVLPNPKVAVSDSKATGGTLAVVPNPKVSVSDSKATGGALVVTPKPSKTITGSLATSGTISARPALSGATSGSTITTGNYGAGDYGDGTYGSYIVLGVANPEIALTDSHATSGSVQGTPAVARSLTSSTTTSNALSTNLATSGTITGSGTESGSTVDKPAIAKALIGSTTESGSAIGDSSQANAGSISGSEATGGTVSRTAQLRGAVGSVTGSTGSVTGTGGHADSLSSSTVSSGSVVGRASFSAALSNASATAGNDQGSPQLKRILNFSYTTTAIFTTRPALAVQLAHLLTSVGVIVGGETTAKQGTVIGSTHEHGYVLGGRNVGRYLSFVFDVNGDPHLVNLYVVTADGLKPTEWGQRTP